MTDLSGLNKNTLNQRALRLLAEVGADASQDNTQLVSRELLRDAIRRGEPLPLGTSVYTTSKGHEVVHGRVYFLDNVSHLDASGQQCNDTLYVDGGALYVVEPHPDFGHLIKTVHAKCIAAVAERTPTGWIAIYTWTWVCAGVPVTYETRWTPDPTRHRAADGKARPALSKDRRALTELRPISQQDEEMFGNMHGRRNDSETFNNWAKNRTPQYGRAASWTLDGQRLDFLMMGVLNDSNTWKRRQNCH